MLTNAPKEIVPRIFGDFLPDGEPDLLLLRTGDTLSMSERDDAREESLDDRRRSILDRILRIAR